MDTSADFESQGCGRDQIPPPPAPLRRSRIPDRDSLKEILEQTLVASDPTDSVSGEELEKFLEVARSHREEPFGLEPVTVELVRAALRSYFEAREDSEEPWGNMSREIARSLYEDSMFQERLRLIWARLLERLP